MTFKELRINDEIRADVVRLIDENNSQVGVVKLEEAKRLAREKGLDLVEVASNVTPPVCKIMDYGRYRFDAVKREKDARKKQVSGRPKEIKLRPTVAEHDLQIKLKNIKNFLEEGEKVKVSVMFRGREMLHQDKGRLLLERLTSDLGSIAAVERPIQVDGRNMFMVLAPDRRKKKEAKDAEN